MFSLNIYKDLARKNKKSVPFCTSKTRKCSQNRITSIISTVTCPIWVKMGHFLGHLRFLPACSFFAAFASLREILPNLEVISRKAAKNAKEAKAENNEDCQRLLKMTVSGIVSVASTPGILIRQIFLYSIQLILIFRTEIL